MTEENFDYSVHTVRIKTPLDVLVYSDSIAGYSVSEDIIKLYINRNIFNAENETVKAFFVDDMKYKVIDVFDLVLECLEHESIHKTILVSEGEEASRKLDKIKLKDYLEVKENKKED